MGKVNLVLLILWKDDIDKTDLHKCESIYKQIADMKSEGIKDVQLAKGTVANIVAFAECEEGKVNNLIEKIQSIEGVDVVDARNIITA